MCRRAAWRRGLGAGVLGTLALSGSEPLRDHVLGHPPPYSVGRIATSAAQAWLGVRPGAREARAWGLLLRWLYGPALGVLHARLRPGLPRSAWFRGLLLGGGVCLFEWLAFPRLRITPPPRRWSPAERRGLVLQCGLFGLVTEAVLSCRRAGE